MNKDINVNSALLVQNPKELFLKLSRLSHCVRKCNFSGGPSENYKWEHKLLCPT